VMRCSDRMVALDFGEVISSGAPSEVRHDDRVVLAYLGASAASTSDTDTLQDDGLLPITTDVRPRAFAPMNEDPPVGDGQATDDLLVVQGLVAGYGGVPVVRHLDLRVGRGEVVALLGPNGAGKSTTLLTIAGELPALGGTMQRLGATNARMPLNHLVNRGLGFVMEERCITASLTTAENLKLGTGGLEEAVEIFPELRNLLRRPAGLLSGGEQRMLALARVLAAKPKLLLADELSLGLAPQIVERLLMAIRDAANSGVGVLLVEQHAEQALEYSDRFLVLRRGEIVSHGEAASIRGNFASLAASYLN
jgi:branched-chain amino acid transport system ATP-binding protein